MNTGSALTRALGELAALATTEQDRERLAALADRVAFTRLRVLIAVEPSVARARW